MSRLNEQDVEWIVNSQSELGVLVGGQAFFLYKGRSLEYGAVIDDVTDKPLSYRPVGKREFGECCHPITGAVSTDDGNHWEPLPAADKEPR